VRSHDSREDTPYLGTLVGEWSQGFNQFGIMQGEVTRSKLFMDPDIFVAKGGNPVSSSRGYQSQFLSGSGPCRGGHICSKKKSRLHPFREQGETSDQPSAVAPLMEPRNEVKGGDQGSLSRRSSPSYRLGNSSPNQSGRAAFEPPSRHVEHDEDVGEEQP
jgi:hypothetical protein